MKIQDLDKLWIELQNYMERSNLHFYKQTREKDEEGKEKTVAKYLLPDQAKEIITKLYPDNPTVYTSTRGHPPHIGHSFLIDRAYNAAKNLGLNFGLVISNLYRWEREGNPWLDREPLKAGPIFRDKKGAIENHLLNHGYDMNMIEIQPFEVYQKRGGKDDPPEGLKTDVFTKKFPNYFIRVTSVENADRLVFMNPKLLIVLGTLENPEYFCLNNERVKASTIREKIGKGDQSWRNYVYPEIADFIDSHPEVIKEIKKML